MMSREVDVIKHLLRNRENDLNINQIAAELKIDYKNAHNIVKRLWKKDILELKKFGKSLKVTLIEKNDPLIFAAEHSRREELLKDKTFKVVLDNFTRNMESKFYVLLLFGSYAKGTSTKHSDIDLFFIVPDGLSDKYETEIRRIASMLPFELHLNFFEEHDFLKMKNSRDFTVGSEAIKNNILLHGIETYYEMIA
jgi:predicted transcriptional regulator/predicted nucleotidyltransferase